jgi:hypothetical protein
MTTTRLSDIPEDYRAAYERGWRYSARPGATLEHLDDTRAPEATYDGYLDYAAGREKWHLARCADCPEHPGHRPVTTPEVSL